MPFKLAKNIKYIQANDMKNIRYLEMCIKAKN